jgi:type II secretory pathway component GspD/PulD (secretin)
VSSVQLGAGSELQLIPESNTNSVIVIATEKELERVRTFVDIFDVPGPKPTFERVELQHAKVDVIQQVLTGLTGARPNRRGQAPADQGLMISSDAASNVIYLAGSEDDVATAKEIIAQADVPGAEEQTHLVLLKKQTPSAMAKILSDMHADPTGSRRGRGAAAAGAGGPRFIGDDASNLLVVICAESDWESINSLIGQLDVGAQDMQVTRTTRWRTC